jgi:hypothetical protein
MPCGIIICAIMQHTLMADYDEYDLAQAEMDCIDDESVPASPCVSAATRVVKATRATTGTKTPWSAFKRYLLKHAVLVKTGEDKLVTHVLMDEGRLLKHYAGARTFGGKMSVQQREDLFAALLEDYDHDVMHPIVETFPEHSRFALD